MYLAAATSLNCPRTRPLVCCLLQWDANDRCHLQACCWRGVALTPVSRGSCHSISSQLNSSFALLSTKGGGDEPHFVCRCVDLASQCRAVAFLYFTRPLPYEQITGSSSSSAWWCCFCRAVCIGRGKSGSGAFTNVLCRADVLSRNVRGIRRVRVVL